ncbi:pentatricopeptide repeat-containing protein At2g03380, mitochondrial-like [Tasmannia lanceolata]|uniref:pentatricopeptide repeat-containing protein At2g03380, mitochondrial-like n=1 Tax=Tasmannia lanceolata TaxID=3420 RepID=UPI0040644127
MPLFSSGFWLSKMKIFHLVPNRTLSWKMGPKKRSFQSSIGAKMPVFEELSIVERFVSLLETCQDVASLRRLHACIFTFGFESNIFLGSKLLNCYASFGYLIESRRVFSKIINRNISLWSSIIVGYFKSNHSSEVLQLYSNLKQQGLGVDSSALTFSLKSCIQLGALEHGRGIHVDAFKFSLNSDRFVGSALIGLYSKCNIEDARLVFEEISERDVVVYTAMVTGYAQMADDRASEAFRIACYMQNKGLDPNRVTLVSLLQAASQLEALEEGRLIHCYAIRRGINHSDEVLETSLVDMYIKCGALSIAVSIFDRTQTQTVATWTAMISGYVQMGEASKALDLFCVMKQENLAPDSITIANSLLACADLRSLRQGTSIHGYIIRTDVHLDLVAVTALIGMYSKCGRVHKAKELFNRMTTRDVISYNVMISGYLHMGFADEAIAMFGRMVEAGHRPNAATMLSILSASALLMDVRKGRWIHGCIMRYGLELDVQVANQILHVYAKCGHIDIARKIFNQIKEKDLVSWSSMMMGYVHHGHADEVLALFWQMKEAGEEPDSVTLISLLQAFSHLGCFKQAKEIHGYVHRMGLDTGFAIINSLVTTYSKCGRLDMAEILFNNMKDPGRTSWNTMIAAHGMHGNSVEALELFNRMKDQNVEPDELTFTSILSVCSHTGLVEEGQRLFHSMTSEHFITPCKEHYACMVDLLGRAGRLEEAYEFLKCFPLRDSISALSSLLAACKVHKNSELGEVIGRKLLDLEPGSSGAYTLIANMYAEAGKWSEVARIRALTKERGLRKMPGYSLIELDNQVCRM